MTKSQMVSFSQERAISLHQLSCLSDIPRMCSSKQKENRNDMVPLETSVVPCFSVHHHLHSDHGILAMSQE
jgi:hypothetical protein